nr:E3 ubiquitin-protein ligase MIEL1 [Ipomoea batatas]
MSELAAELSGAPRLEPITSQVVEKEEKTVGFGEASQGSNMYRRESFQENVSGTEALDKGALCLSVHHHSHVFIPLFLNGVAALIISGGARLELLAAMKYLIAGIVIMRQKLYAHFVALNKRLSKFASTVVFAWGDTFVKHASYLMMIHLKDNIIVVDVAFVELAERKISSTALNVISFFLSSSNLNENINRQYLFESRNDVTVLPCGHTLHKNCLKEMQEHYQYTCPICSKSVCDMSKVWEKFDAEIAATPMPESYRNEKVITIFLSESISISLLFAVLFFYIIS